VKIFWARALISIEIYQGAGAFVCGEETALMRSIEGKRGMPRPRPPFPAHKGLWEKPTIFNNVETFSNVPQIMTNGGAWYAVSVPKPARAPRCSPSPVMSTISAGGSTHGT
jgi:NADH:ubiquinone oxidoreductase subunit F (NADH-binding)